MRRLLKTALAATTLAGATLFAAAPSQAGISFSFSFGVPNGVAFSHESGGYCDDWGCPDAYWDMPIYYGPVFWDGHWYKGPLYYREWHGKRWYWVRGDWRRDQWRGPRPNWWRGDYRVGPALGYNFYLSNGFRHDRDRWWRGNDWRPGRDWDRNRWRNGPWAHPDGRPGWDRPGMVGGVGRPGEWNGPGRPGDVTGPGRPGDVTGPGSGRPGGGSMTGPGGGKPGGGGRGHR